jgi:hypothetical protein
MEAALLAALPAGTAVGATACAQADVEIADTIVTSIRKARRFMLSSFFVLAAPNTLYVCA